MADRKQFQHIPAVDPELTHALEAARQKDPTEDELHEQRVSFAFGNAPFDAKQISKESVRLASKRIRLLD